MNDKLLFENYLLLLKSTVEVYVHGTLESSNDDVRNTLKKGLDDIMKCQADTYTKMTEEGWYQVSNVKEKDIVKTIDNINNN